MPASRRAHGVLSPHFLLEWAETEEKKAKGENIRATARLPASIAAGPLLHCMHIRDGPKPGRGEETGRGKAHCVDLGFPNVPSEAREK